MVCTLLGLALAATPVRVAVLPFENATNEPEYEVLRKGLADLLITDLAGSPSLVVVERERLADLLAEVKLQQTKAFDQRTTVKVGRALGASYAVVGSLVAVAPRVRLTARVVDVEKQTVLLTASAQGLPADLFELEQQLVGQLLPALRATSEGLRSGHASLGTLLTYAQGLDAADRGQLDEAKSKLAEAVRTGPDFTLAKDRYADILKRLRAAQKKRGSVQDEAAAVLAAHLQALLGKPPVEHALGARVGLANLALLELSRLVGGSQDRASYVEPAKRAEVEALEARFVVHASALVAELSAVRGRNIDPQLPEADEALSKQAFGLDVSQWDFATPTMVATDLGQFLGSGWTPYRVDLPQFAVRPSAAQRSPAQLQAAQQWFERAQKELPLDGAAKSDRETLTLLLANQRAEMLVLLGRREEAVAQWQGFLDAFPTAAEFPAVSKKVAALMLLDDDADREERQLKACDVALLEQGPALATRTWRAKGRAGLLALSQALRGCAKKDAKFERAAWALPAAELARVADCEGHELHRSRAQQAGVALEACRP